MTARTEIETRLLTWANAQNPPIPVAFQNVKFIKPTKGPFLELIMLGDRVANRDLAAAGIRTVGMFQINCYAPVGLGMAQVEALASSVVNLYPVLPKTGTVSIESPLNTTSSIVVDNYILVPVRATYRTEA